jgi:hypothetical protein
MSNDNYKKKIEERCQLFFASPYLNELKNFVALFVVFLENSLKLEALLPPLVPLLFGMN